MDEMMERLTKWVDGEVKPNHGYRQKKTGSGRMVDMEVGHNDLYLKLASYEDTGLTPERVAELAEAHGMKG